MIEIEVKSLQGEVRSVVNARKLHALLEVKRKFADWIKDKLKNYTEGEHYVMIPFRNENNGKVSVSKEYYILLDIAKEIAKDRTALVDYLTECQEKYEPERYGQKALLDVDLKVLEDGSVNARDLHRFLEVGTRFNDWITRRIENFGFRDGKDYYSYLSKGVAKDYSLSLSMAKELCMVENNEKGKAARLYFLECEENLQKKEEQFSVKDRHMLDVIYAKSKEETILALKALNQDVIEPLEQKVEEQDEELRKMRLQRGIALYELVQQHHKSFYYDLILNTPDMFTVTEIASDYGLSAKDLNKILEEEKAKLGSILADMGDRLRFEPISENLEKLEAIQEMLNGFKEDSYVDSNGRKQKAYNLTEGAATQILLRYSPEARAYFIYQFKKMHQTIINMFKVKVVEQVLPEIKGEQKYLYIIRNEDSGNIKLGISSDPHDRLKQLQTGNDSELRLVYSSYVCTNAREIEKAMHEYFQDSRIRGEWFSVSVEEAIRYMNNVVYRLNSKMPSLEHIYHPPHR